MNGGMEGALLGERYRVVRLIGRGGMGAVYEGVQEDLGRRVAIKILHPHLSVDREVVERFRREAQATAALAHPNIVQVTDCRWEAGGPLYLVMELLSGKSLGFLLMTQGRLPSRRVAFIAAQTLDALAAAHRAGIVHRDVKPDNIFLTSMAQVHDVVKVLDFGVAKLTGAGPEASLTTTGAAVGTPYYMAPEQARGMPVDARTDVYAVGVCMYHALSGRLPFSAPSFNALMFAIAEQQAPPLGAIATEVEPGIVAIVERAMQKDPARRFASAAEMAAALTPFVTPTTTVSVTPPSALLGVTDPTAPTMAATPAQMAASPRTAAPRSSASTTWVVVGCVALIFVVVGVAVANLLLTKSMQKPAGTPLADAAASASIAASSASAPSSAAVAPAVASADAGRAPRDAGHIAIVDAGAATDAEPPPPPDPPRPSAARQIHASFWQTNNCCELSTFRGAIAAHAGAFTACVNGGSPPADKFPMYDLHVTPAGAVTSVVVLGGMKPGDGPFHSCMQTALRGVAVGKLDPKCEGSTVRVGFNAE